MVSLRFGGVRFVVYANDHPPRHVHGFCGGTEAIVDLRADRTVALAKRRDAVRPPNAKRSDVKKVLNAAAERFDDLTHYGSLCMAKQNLATKPARARVITSDTEIDRAIKRARQFRTEPLVTEVEYRPGPGLDLLILRLSDGRRHMIPREDLQGLQSGTKEQISHIEILGGGTGLHWPDLDVDLYVPSLLRGIYGNHHWMAKIGQRGGLATTPAKKRASRANGRLGGRPKRTEAAGD